QVLAQIIFEQENKEGQSLLPIAFLRQLIRFYGDSMQMLVPRYLEVSIDSLTREQEKFRQQMAQAFGGSPFGALEDQVRRNMEMFERAFAMFTPFGRREGQPSAEPDKGHSQPGGSSEEIHDLKRQMEEMQKRLDRLSDKDKTYPRLGWARLPPPLIPQRAAVFARIGTPDQYAPLPVDADRLRAAPRRRRKRHLVAARQKSFDARCRQSPLDHARSSHEECAWPVDRRLHVHAVVDQVGTALRVPHGLVVRSHDPERQIAPPATKSERRDDGMHRPLVGTERIGMVGIHHETGAAIGEHDTCLLRAYAD